MRRSGFLLLALALAGPARADPVDDLLRAARGAEEKLATARALELYQAADAARPKDAAILQKIAKQYSDLVPAQPTDAAKRDFATRGLRYAQRAVELEPQNAEYVLSLAICHGHLATVSEVRAKVEYSRLIKADAERALQLDPDYAWAHHVLGRWHYEVAGLGATARFLVRLLYGGMPPASVEEGVKHLLRATELEPDDLNHWIDLGFAYAAAGKPAEAKAAWQRGLTLPVRTPHDAKSLQRAREALAAVK